MLKVDFVTEDNDAVKLKYNRVNILFRISCSRDEILTVPVTLYGTPVPNIAPVMPGCDWKLWELEGTIEKVRDVTKTVQKLYKSVNKRWALDMKDKMGDKLSQTILIIDFTITSLGANELFSKMQDYVWT